MTHGSRAALACAATGVVLTLGIATALHAQQRQSEPITVVDPRGASSYAPVALERPFADVMREMSAQKEPMMRRQMALLEERYDLSDRPVEGATMSNG